MKKEFRVWDETRLEMVYFDIPLLFDESTTFFENQIKGNYIMQYTGFYDIDGFPICENDIIEYINAPGYEKDGTAQVVWDYDYAAFYIENDKDDVFESIYNVTGFCRVIGNIYQHENLL